MQFADLRIPTGTRMQLTITGLDYKVQTLPAQLLGYRTGATLLVYLAKKPTVGIQRDAKVSARVGLQSAIIQFDSLVELVSEYPYFYLHLKYPSAVVIERQLRQCPRFELDVPVSATVAANPDNLVLPGRLIDISLNGARLSLQQEISVTELRLTANIFAVGEQQQLDLQAKIQSRSSPASDEAGVGFTYGVSFVDVSATQKLLLQALCYELQATGGI